MVEALLQQLADRITGSIKDETARQLYLDINISGLKDGNDEENAAAFDAHKDAILPVLIKGKPRFEKPHSSRDCYRSATCNQVVHSATTLQSSPPCLYMSHSSALSRCGRLGINEGGTRSNVFF